MRIDPHKTIALLLDYQERIVPAMLDGEQVIANTVKLATGLNLLDIPIILTEQYPKGLGPTVPQLKELDFLPQPLPKTSLSCLFDDDIAAAIKATKAKHVIISGMETHVCVLQTLIDLIEEGYWVYIVDECCASRTSFNHRNGVKRAMQEGAFITNTETILFEILQYASGDTFKSISRLIK